MPSNPNVLWSAFTSCRALHLAAMIVLLVPASKAADSPVAILAQTSSGPTVDVASLNPAFVLTPNQVRDVLLKARSFDNNASALAAFLARFQKEAKTTKGPADASGWASIIGIGGNELVQQSITRGADSQPHAVDIAPPTYVSGLYAPQELQITVRLESHYHKGGLNSSGRVANATSATINSVVVADDKGDQYPTTEMNDFASVGTDHIREIQITGQSSNSTSANAPITLSNGYPVAGGVSADPTGSDTSTSSATISRNTNDQPYYMRTVTCHLALFNVDGSPRFGAGVRTITVRAMTMTGEMDIKFDLKDYQHK